MRKKSLSFYIILWTIFTTAVIIAIAIFGFLGYRLVIAENARPDWEGINTVTSWLVAPITVIFAIAGSIAIPLSIARKQNKIALFEKRYLVYTVYTESKKYFQRILSSYERDGEPDTYLLEWVASKMESHPELNSIYYDIKNSLKASDVDRKTILSCTHALNSVLICDMQGFSQGQLLFENKKVVTSLAQIANHYENFVRILIDYLYSYYDYSLVKSDTDIIVSQIRATSEEVLKLIDAVSNTDFELDIKQSVF